MTTTSEVSPVPLPEPRLDPLAREVRARYHELLESGEPGEWAYSWRSELNRGGFRAVDFLMDEIVDSGKCIGCASCVTICPVDVFDYVDERPVDTRTDACVYCVMCTDVCPVLRPPDADQDAFVDYRTPTNEEGYGLYSYGLYTRATDPELLDRGQDGGMVSALLIHGLENGTLGGAILGDVEPDNNQIGRHKLARDRAEVLSCAASRYTYSPNTLALQDAMRQDVKPLAVVGVPCQVDGVRLQQHSAVRLEMADWYRDNISLVIGLYCSESFTHESIEKLGEMLDVPAQRIENINIKGKVVVRLDDGEVRTTSLKQYRDFARPACLYCLDYSAEAADIGAGGIGMDGWTNTLVRTKKGHEVLSAAIAEGWLETRPFSDEPSGKRLLRVLSRSKKRNRPLPALMPTHQERLEMGSLDPKTFYTKGPGSPNYNGSKP